MANHRVHPIDRVLIVAHHFVDLVREEIAHRPFHQVRLFKNAARRRFVLDQLFHARPLLDEHAQVAHKITRPLAFAHGADNHAHPFRNFQAAQNLPEPVALFRVLDFARDATTIAVGHEHQIAPGEAQVRRHSRTFRPDRPFGYLHDYVGTDRINAGNVFRRDPLFRLAAPGPIDFLNPAVERRRDRIPEMEERIFLEADVDEHRLQPHLDVLNFSLVDAADDVPGGVALDVIFFESPVLEKRHPALEFLDTDY